MGDLSPSESKEVEKLAAQHIEIREELNRIELALEKYALALGTPPPPGTLSSVLETIEKNAPTSSGAASPSGPYLTLVLGLLAVIGLITSLFFLVRNHSLNQEVQGQQADLANLQKNCDELQVRYDQLSSNLDLISNPATIPVRMVGTANAPKAVATVFFNPTQQVAVLNTGTLPEPPPDMTYQLWALVDGNPVDMGIFYFPQSSKELIVVPFVEGAGAFAVTLETAGGNPIPNLDQLFVIGNVG